MRTPLLLVALTGLSLSHAASAQSVTDLWATSCANCHGEKGEGGGAGTRTLLTPELSDPTDGVTVDRRFFGAIKKGVEGSAMPGFADTMNDAKVWSLVVHLRELQERARKERGEGPRAVKGEFTSKHARYQVKDVVPAGLDVPWAVDFIPADAPASGPTPGAMIITERPGGVRFWSGSSLSAPVSGTPAVRNRGQGGLMDVAVHPDFKTNGWIYLSFSDQAGEGSRAPGFTKVVRGHIVKQGTTWAWTDQQTIFEAQKEHYLPTDIHFGSRLVFTAPNPDGRRYLFFGIGERGHGELAQKLDRPNGKVYRVFDDGSVPTDNPFVAWPGAYPAIWSYGHRNPQGLTLDLQGTLWDTEHGPRGGDELNLIAKAHNYGWQTVSFGINYNDSPLASPWPAKEDSPLDPATDGIVLPRFRWLPSIGACGLTVCSGGPVDAWKGDLFAGGLSGANVDRIRTKDGIVIEHERILEKMGRVRDVFCGPDGLIYIVLNGPDKIVRIEPTPASAPAAGKVTP